MIGKIFPKISYFLLLVTVVVSFFIYGLNVTPNGDNVEHLHASWLISQGYIPYRDFFQHHNPFIWYIYAPIVSLLINNIIIFKCFSVISFATLLFIVYIQLKILKQLKVNKVIQLLFASMILSSYSILWSADYRPDTTMYMFLFAGIYYLFQYINKFKQKYIICSFLLFYLGFMCTQKILFNFLVIGLFIIFLVYRKQITIKSVLQACILPLAISLIYILYLYLNDSLLIYWKSCYPFNSKLPSFFVNSRITFPPLEYYDIYLFAILGFLSSIYFLIKGTIKERLISILFLEELFCRLFYFSAFLHYNTLLILLSIMLIFMFVSKITEYKNIITSICCIYVIFANYYNYNNTYLVEKLNSKQMKAYEYYFENTNHCDYVLNGYYAVDNLKSKDLGYYTILLGQIDILGEKIGIRPRDNLNNLILKYKPKIIYGDVYWNMYQRERGRSVPAHVIDKKIINEYYQYSSIGNIYILKKEYQKKYCRKLGNKWEYVD